MIQENDLYIVSSEVLPEVFRHVVEAKTLLNTGRVNTINEAVKIVGISRSTYYKYKDFVSSFTEGTRGKIITLSLTLEDIPGVLSSILNMIAEVGGNILTINQNIPINGVANLTISINTREVREGQEVLIGILKDIKGVIRTDVLAQE